MSERVSMEMPQSVSTDELKKYNILCVGDDTSVTKRIARAIALEDFRVLTANSAEDGIKVLLETDIALIISDQVMPGGMPGTDFLAKARALKPNVLRIILSGYTEQQYLAEAINKANALYYLVKPWDDDELLRIVKEGLYAYHQNWVQIKKASHLSKLLAKTKTFSDLATYASSVIHSARNITFPLGNFMTALKEDLSELTSIKKIEEVSQLLDERLQAMLDMAKAGETATEELASLFESARSFFQSSDTEEEFDLAIVIERSIQLMRVSRKFSNIEIHFSKQGNDFRLYSLKGFVSGNMIEFLKNAADAIVEKNKEGVGTIWVVLSEHTTMDQDDSLRLTVQDDGCGIDQKIINKIFAPLFSTKQDKGTGIGLTAIYDMAQRQNGSIDVESVVGQGTTFTVILPKKLLN